MGRDDINGAPWILPPGASCPAAQLVSADSPPANEHPQLYVRVGRILASPRCRVATPRWQLTSLPRWHPTLSPFRHEEWQHTGRQLIILSDSTNAPVKICFVTSGAIGDCGRSRLLSVVRGHSFHGPLVIEDLPARPCGLLRRPTPPHSQDMRRPPHPSRECHPESNPRIARPLLSFRTADVPGPSHWQDSAIEASRVRQPLSRRVAFALPPCSSGQIPLNSRLSHVAIAHQFPPFCTTFQVPGRN